MCIHIYIYIERERHTVRICVYLSLYIYSMYAYIHIYIYIYIYREREIYICCISVITAGCQGPTRPLIVDVCVCRGRLTVQAAYGQFPNQESSNCEFGSNKFLHKGGGLS